MEQSTTQAQVHETPVKVHKSRTKLTESKHKHRSHSKHKCHKSKYYDKKVTDDKNLLLLELDEYKRLNTKLQKRLDNSVTSIDSGVPVDLPPLDMDVTEAYQHLKHENNRIISENNNLCEENKSLIVKLDKLTSTNVDKDNDILLLKNLVYRLNVELEKYQSGSKSEPKECVRNFILPDFYEKNFMKPLLPLLKAYSEVIYEKNEIIENYESDFINFSKTMKDILLENEKLYKELELHESSSHEVGYEDVKKDNSYLKQENKLLNNQLDLLKDKLKQVQTLFKTKGKS